MNSAGLGKRIALGMSGQAFSRLIYALNTIALVPILIRAWGVGGYGQWIALTALASYLSYSSFGLVTTSVNEIIMAIGANDVARARLTFQMSVNLTLYLIAPLLLVMMGVAAILPISDILQLSQIGNSGALLIISLAAAQLWIMTLRGPFVASLYAVGSYGFAYYVSGCAKALELVAIGIAVTYFGATQVTAAAIMAACAGLDFLVVATVASRQAPWARPDLRILEGAWFRAQIRPAVGYLLSNLSIQGVLVNGPRVVLGAILGGRAVAIYAIFRDIDTACRSAPDVDLGSTPDRNVP